MSGLIEAYGKGVCAILVLQRKVDEATVIDLGPLIEQAVSAAGHMGDEVRIALLDYLQQQTTIEVKPVAFRAGSIRIGFEAPRNVPVHRAEIHDEIQATKLQQGTE